MTLRPLLLILLLPIAAYAQATDDTPDVALQPHWFAPTDGAGRTVDVTPSRKSTESVTVIGNRPSRSWRSKVQAQGLNRPLASNAAHPLTPLKSYCNSTLRTVGGQPASPADMVTGMGAGGC